MAEKNADQIKALYTEIAKIAPSQDWERILKVAKKSNYHFFGSFFLIRSKNN
jgi:hypothetical protein